MIAPRLNEQDADDIPEHLRADLEFVFVDQIREVLDAALEDGAHEARAPARARRKRPRRVATPARRAARPRAQRGR